MEILDFKVEEGLLENNLIEFANTIRTLLFNEDESLFELIDVTSDEVFLEPSLFSYFSCKNAGKVVVSLRQLLWGYIAPGDRPDCIEVISDSHGVITLPNYGYGLCGPNQKLQLLWDRDRSHITFLKDGMNVEVSMVKPLLLSESKIKFAVNQPEFLFLNDGSDILESVLDTTSAHMAVVCAAWCKMKNQVSGFTNLLEKTNKEVLVFNSLTQYSRASFSYYGTAFINVGNKKRNELFFIDDIAHQCGHVLFYALSFPPQTFLKPPQRTPLKQFTQVDWETRDIYGCFHGLFTYSTIIFCLDQCIEALISEHEKHEAIGRLAFYMDKFRKDIANMNDSAILTTKGFDYFDMFKAGYDRMYQKYKGILRYSDFSNQSYLFDYARFETLNPIKSVL